MKETVNAASKITPREIVFTNGSAEAKIKEGTFGLKRMEYELLAFLAVNKGKVLSRHTIMEYLWEGVAGVSAQTLHVHVARLRRKLRVNGFPPLIKTIHCFGYVLSDSGRLPPDSKGFPDIR